MLDTGSSLSFISTRLFQYLPKSIMEPTSFDAQMADGSALAVKKLHTVLIWSMGGDMTLHVALSAV